MVGWGWRGPAEGPFHSEGWLERMEGRRRHVVVSPYSILCISGGGRLRGDGGDGWVVVWWCSGVVHGCGVSAIKRIGI